MAFAFHVSILKPGSHDAGAASVTRSSYLLTSQILFQMLSFMTIWLVGCWLSLVMQCWNRNRVYSSVIPALAKLRWCQHHYEPLLIHYYNVLCVCMHV